MEIVRRQTGALAKKLDLEFEGDYGLLAMIARELGHEDKPRTLLYGAIWTILIFVALAGWAPSALVFAIVAIADLKRPEPSETAEAAVDLPQEVLGRLVPISSPKAEQSEAKPYTRGDTHLYETIPAFATLSSEDHRQTEAMGKGRGVATAQVTALSRLLQSPLANRAFIGAQRTGKSGLVAVAGRELAKQGYTFYHINLASYSDGGSEDDDYTKHIHPSNSVRGDIAISRSKEEVYRLVDRATSLVHDWFATKNSILIVDEWFSLASQTIDYADITYPLAQLIAGKLAHLTSAGTKRGLAIWMITPQVKAGAMTEAGKEIKQCKLCYVGIAPNKSIQWGNNLITWDAELFSYVSKNFPIEYPSGSAIQGEVRISYVNGEWFPLGTTESHFEEMARAPKTFEKEENKEEERKNDSDNSLSDLESQLNALWEEDDITQQTDVIDKSIFLLKKTDDPKRLCFADLLEAIKRKGLKLIKENKPLELTARDATSFQWSQDWSEERESKPKQLAGRKQEDVRPWLARVAKLGFLIHLDDDKYKINLS